MTKPLLATVIVAASASLYFLPPPAGVGAGAMRAAALILFAVGMWAFNVLPEHITGILFLLLTVVLGVARPAVVFSGSPLHPHGQG